MCLDLDCLIFARLLVLFRTSSLLFYKPGMPKSVLILVSELGFRVWGALGFEGFFAALVCFPP